MYPIFIVILVHYKSSTEETYSISALLAGSEIIVKDFEAYPATVGHHSFAAPQSTTGSTGSGQCLGGPIDTFSVEGERNRTATRNDNGVGSKAEEEHCRVYLHPEPVRHDAFQHSALA